MECDAKIYLFYCKCILYYMPRFEDNITICGRSNDICVDYIKNQIQGQSNESFICNCLPGCFEVNYDSEVSMAPIFQQTPILAKRNLFGPNISVAHMFYKKNFFRSQKKDELIGFTEFLCMTHSYLYIWFLLVDFDDISSNLMVFFFFNLVKKFRSFL